MASFADVLGALCAKAHNTVEQGTLFEQLMKAVLKQYREHGFEDVWLWKEWPKRPDTPQGRQDHGIDLVGKKSGEPGFCAIQCKFFAPDSTVYGTHINSFLAKSGGQDFTSRLLITTANTSTAVRAMVKNQHIPCALLDFNALKAWSIEWDLHHPEKTIVKHQKKELRPHQQEALAAVQKGFAQAERGKLIMACGSGKTFTALRIAEAQTPENGHVLVLTPSIALTSQTLHEWAWEYQTPQRYLAVCSDAQVHKTSKGDEDLSVEDMAIPPTTKVEKIVEALQSHTTEKPHDKRTVVFCTYQSLDKIHAAQELGAPSFDLVICDEAHRTTGVGDGGNISLFSRIHDEGYVKAKKRLYMTATPRIYTERAKKKATENDIVVYSMDDVDTYGEEFYRLGFAEAIAAALLTDYRVIIFAIQEDYAIRKLQSSTPSFQDLSVDDYAKIAGCYDALKTQGKPDNHPLKRAVSFSSTIKHSKAITDSFAQVVKSLNPQDDAFLCETKHVDGTHSAFERNKRLNWLREEPPQQADKRVCHILSNARCLTEGVDAPSLDAVIFMNARRSQVDVVQAVGRVMRKAEGKDYGYVILPVLAPHDKTPEEALDDNKTYEVVWEVLRALRSHDENFDPAMVDIVGLGFGEGSNKNRKNGDNGDAPEAEHDTKQLAALQQAISFEEYKEAIYAKLVRKVGNREYWEEWGKDVAHIYTILVKRINDLYAKNLQVKSTFDAFLAGLQKSVSQEIDAEEGMAMLAQQIITGPVFDALFEGYSFTSQNPVSTSMNAVLGVLLANGLKAERDKIQGFYDSVKREVRTRNATDPANRQQLMLNLYERFFKTAFKKISQSLGIAYTPIELVDFVLASADEALHAEFGRRLSDESVHVIDPFTGTGSFINRLVQNPALIKTADLPRKYAQELHANDILLLAYYIATINIENAYHARMGGEYQPFPGAVLTDTFNLYERDGAFEADGFSPENSARLNRQRQAPITVVVGNPPWSAGQTSENDANKNLAYPQLDARIAATYVAQSTATKTKAYDSYIRALRWASERIGKEGVIALVTNGGFLEGRSADGLRKSLVKEFDAIWCLNLRGNARLSGEASRREGEKVFGVSSRATVTMTILVKNPAKPRAKAELHYADIGDYLKRREKLDKVKRAGHIHGEALAWQRITPDAAGDWLDQRDPHFQTLLPLGSKAVKAGKVLAPDTCFILYSNGLKTNRDAWAYNFGRGALAKNMERMVTFYNRQVEGLQGARRAQPDLTPDAFVDNDPRKISWSRALKTDLGRGKPGQFEAGRIRQGEYRPFTPHWLYFDRQFNEMVYRQFDIFPEAASQNLAICVSVSGGETEFSVLMTKFVPDFKLVNKGQCFPRWFYKDGERHSNIPSQALAKFRQHYTDKTIDADALFDYVYGVLHSPVYRARFANNLRKELPRVPLAPNFAAFAVAGKRLAALHLNYQSAPPHRLQILHTGQLALPATLTPEDLRVAKMRWASNTDKTAIAYNSRIRVEGIPAQALQYTVSGKAPLEWLLDRWQIKTDKDSAIVNDPNAWCPEDPHYILTLIGRLTHVGIESARVIEGLPTDIGV